jgi:hypothetical protein
MDKPVYFSEWAGKISMSRAARRMRIPCEDSPPPKRFTPEDVIWHLKLVAHWEGGPGPDHAAAQPVKFNEEFEMFQPGHHGNRLIPK